MKFPLGRLLAAAVPLALAACAATAPPTAATPDAVFDRYVAAVNASDMAAITAMISPQVERSDYVGCKPEMDNKACLAHYIQTTVVGAGGRITVVSRELRGDTVHAVLELRSKTATDAGVERLVGTDIVRASGGQITGFRFVPRFADEQTAVFFGKLGIGPRAVKR